MYYKLTLSEQPRILFAHSYTTSHYAMHFPAAPRNVEISYNQEGDTYRLIDGGERIHHPPGHFLLSTYERESRGMSDAPCCRHITVGFDVGYTRETLTREALLADLHTQRPCATVFYMPETGIPAREGGAAESTLRQLIARYTLPEAGQSLRCMSLLFELMAILTEETVRMALLEEGNLSLAALTYARRAVRYIAEHLTEKLTVAQIADHLHISSGYLSALFREYTGCGVTHYINATRIERVKELLVSRHMHLREAGESVGFGDENYVSRLFKQHTGQSVREFLRQTRTDTAAPESE